MASLSASAAPSHAFSQLFRGQSSRAPFTDVNLRLRRETEISTEATQPGAASANDSEAARPLVSQQDAEICMELFEGSLLDLLPSPATTHSRPKRAGATRTAAPLPTLDDAPDKTFAKSVTLPKRLRRPGCTCGACHTCRENARWERIFNEKFADPTYYNDRGPQFSSPLSEAGVG